MNILSVENISKTWSDEALFKNLTFGISAGEKIALIAKNGAGKSSLLNIITQKEKPDTGVVAIPKNIRWHYVSQEPNINLEKNILENAMFGESKVQLVFNKYTEAVKLGHESKLAEAEHEMVANNVWEMVASAKEILSKLDLPNSELPTINLSGGQKKRLAIARALIEDPDFLILDEPTNHLDIEMIEFLETQLLKNNLGLIMVTHDRFFLDRICDRIIELDNKILYEYKGNYQYYLEKKQHRLEVEQSEYNKNKNTYSREIEWVRRMPKARGTKSKSRLQAFDDLSDKLKQHSGTKDINMQIKMNRIGSKIMEVHQLSKQFNEKILFENFNYIFKRGEKIGIIGKNGSGKTTFLNILMDKEKPNSGNITIGETIIFGYFTQHSIPVSDSKKVIDVITEIAEYIPLEKGLKLTASQLLLNFGFSKDQQYNYVEKLSGGEKRRLQLLTILMKNPNFLILDEPTNDFDIETLHTLEEFLIHFQGCVLIVSHDRFFMNKIVDHVFVFGNKTIKDFPGNYNDYLDWKEQQQPEKKIVTMQQLNNNVIKKNENKLIKLSFNEKRELETLEAELTNLEIKKTEIINLLSTTTDYKMIQELSTNLEEIKNKVDKMEMRWLELDSKSN